MKNIVALILISFLAFATAATITLQTNCSFSNSSVYFTIRNIGDTGAYYLNILPILEGKKYPDLEKDVLSQNESMNFKIPFQVVENGTYLSVLSIGYEDNWKVPAYTIAHCPFYYGSPLLSPLYLSANLSAIESDKYKLNVSITNLGEIPINATLFVYLPSSFFSNFSNSSISNFSFSIPQKQTKQFSSTIKYIGKVQGSFEGVAVASFSLNGKHFTSFAVFKLQLPSSLSNNKNLFIIQILVAIAVIPIVFVIFLILKRRKVIK